MNFTVKNSLYCLFFIFTCLTGSIVAQCNVVTSSSSCGYTVYTRIVPVSIVPSSGTCPSGYNYNVRFTYTITVTGVNTCYNDNIGIQPQILCSGQNNGYYSINVPAPTVGAGFSTTNHTGTLTTTSNQYFSSSDCATATPASKNCSSVQASEYGPGLTSTTYPCSSGLPITLLEFKAAYVSGKAILNWSTATEKNNEFFTVERSTDGENWSLAATVKGAGTSSRELHYQAEDTGFERGINYYRLKQTDFDGSFKYSDIAFINTANDNSPAKIYPNPFNNTINIEMEKAGEIFIYNNFNQVLIHQQVEKNLQLDVSLLPTGLYHLKMRSGNEENNFKIIKE